jgi:hypothetical protein
MNKKRSEIIAFSLVLVMIGLASASYSPVYYKLNMNYENNELNVKSINVEVSLEDFNKVGDNIFEIMDFNGNIIENENFIIPNKVAYDYADKDGKITSGKIVELSNLSFEIYVPYYENAREIIFYDENKSLLGKTDVSRYSKYGQASGGNANQNDKTNNEIIGGDKDEHGCIGSAGYSWCEEKQKCLRTWEEKCEVENSSSGNIISQISENRNKIILFLIAVVLIILIVVLFKKK